MQPSVLKNMRIERKTMADFTFDTQKIDDLIQRVKSSGIYKIKLKCDEFEIEIQTAPAQSLLSAAPTFQSMASRNSVELSDTADSALTAQETGQVVTSPIVGTFYVAPSPDKPPFVKEGQSVKKGDVLFIIESMKLMNEIKSEYDGTVKKILVESGDGVEYHQPILIIE